jgi:hypothetical protein
MLLAEMMEDQRSKGRALMEDQQSAHIEVKDLGVLGLTVDERSINGGCTA